MNILLATLANGRPGKKWDQFQVNEDKFGVTTSFDEHQYTSHGLPEGVAPDGVKVRRGAWGLLQPVRHADRVLRGPPAMYVTSGRAESSA